VVRSEGFVVSTGFIDDKIDDRFSTNEKNIV
jgi:hypothetical protein